MPMAEANYHRKVPTLQSAQGRIKLGMGPRTVPVRSPQEPARMLAIPQNPGVAGAAADRDGSRSGELNAAPQSAGRIFRLKDARQQASLGADNYASVN